MFAELDDASLLPSAEAVARAFGSQHWVSRPSVADALAAGLGEKAARRTRRGLVARGVIWPKDSGYEPGIPSLLNYLAQVYCDAAG